MRSSYITFAGLFFVLIGGILHAQEQNSLTVEQIAREIGKSNAMIVVGLELIPQAHDTIHDLRGLRDAMIRLDWPTVSKVIATETDYECISGKDYILIRPKINPALHDLPLSSRKVSFPKITNIPFGQFLAKVQGVDDPEYGASLSNSGQYLGQLLEGSITIDAGQDLCFVLLNQVARQLHSNTWVMGHFVLLDSDKKKEKLPMSLNIGLVSFFK